MKVRHQRGLERSSLQKFFKRCTQRQKYEDEDDYNEHDHHRFRPGLKGRSADSAHRATLWSSQTVKTDKVMRSTGLSKMVGFVVLEGQAVGK